MDRLTYLKVCKLIIMSKFIKTLDTYIITFLRGKLLLRIKFLFVYQLMLISIGGVEIMVSEYICRQYPIGIVYTSVILLIVFRACFLKYKHNYLAADKPKICKKETRSFPFTSKFSGLLTKVLEPISVGVLTAGGIAYNGIEVIDNNNVTKAQHSRNQWLNKMPISEPPSQIWGYHSFFLSPGTIMKPGSYSVYTKLTPTEPPRKLECRDVEGDMIMSRFMTESWYCSNIENSIRKEYLEKGVDVNVIKNR